MASVSGTNSLGNTALRGFGGLASGIDRDAIIEQMSLATTTKINNQKGAMTSLNWRQEAFRSISDKILNLHDNFFSFASTTSLRSVSLFAKSQVTAMGDPTTSKYITATGSSNMIDHMSILAAKQATAARAISKKHGSGEITTGIDSDMLTDTDKFRTSNLSGKTITFASHSDSGYQNSVTLTLPDSFKDKDGNTVKIDYVEDSVDDIVKKLNEYLDSSENLKFGTQKLSENIQFTNEGGKIGLKATSVGEGNGILIRGGSSSALTALGYDGKKNDGTEIDTSKGLTIGDFNEGVKKGAYEKNSITEKSGAQRLLGQKFTVNYAGQKKEIEFLNEADLIKLGFSKDAKDAAGNDIKVVDWDKVHDTTKDANGKINGLDVEDLKVLIQERMDKAFGTGKVKVDSIKTVKDDGTKTESLTFNTTDTSQTLTVSAVNTAAGKDLIGINGASNKVSLGGTLKDNAGRLGLTLADPANGVKGDLANGLTINGVKLEVDETTTVQSLLDQINNNKEIGVRATYLSGENTFALVSTNTGSGRGITFGTKDETDGGLAAKIFGDGKNVDGTDAEMLVSYGEGLETVVKSSSNTFDLEGMEVTVSGNFNVEGTGENVHVMPKDKVDRSKAVTFNAKADVDGALDAVKKFIEEYNALIKEVNTQISTKPSGSYKPLTDEQKDEMSEKEIENWEKKAKEGLLFNDPTLRDLNSDLQGIFAEIIGNGVKPEDLEKIGITASSDWFSGGELIFDEEKFKDAMNTEPELVSNVICGGGTAKKGLAQTIEDTLTRYATRFSSRNQGAGGTGKGTYGRLIEEAGSEKIPSSMKKNLIDEQLKTMQENLDKLKEKLSVEQDRYISQFATMEKLISQMNSQSGWLASLTA